MRYTASTRDRYRLAVAAASGLATVAVLGATGAIAGALAHDFTADRARKAADDRAAKLVWKRQQRELSRATEAFAARQAANAERGSVLRRERPQVERVTTRYTVSDPTVGGGGSVGGGSGRSGGGGGSGGGNNPSPSPSPSPTPAPPPPPPPPPPPSSGS